MALPSIKPATGIATTGFTLYYGLWYRRRPLSKLSMLLIAPVAYTVGMLPGAMAQVRSNFAI